MMTDQVLKDLLMLFIMLDINFNVKEMSKVTVLVANKAFG